MEARSIEYRIVLFVYCKKVGAGDARREQGWANDRALVQTAEVRSGHETHSTTSEDNR